MTIGLRRSALVLHSLEPADRDWILHRLSASSVAALQLQMNELRASGAAHLGWEDVKALVGLGAKPTGSSLSAPSVNVHPDVLVDLLTGEPEILWVAVLRRPEIMVSEPEHSRGLSRVRAHRDAAKRDERVIGPALSDCIAKSVLGRLEDTLNVPQRPAAPLPPAVAASSPTGLRRLVEKMPWKR